MNLYDFIDTVVVAPLQYPFMQRALVAAVIIGITAGIMGSYMLVKRWSLMGDAISHAVLPGVALAYLLGWPFFVGSLATGLITAVGIGYVERNSKIKSDAAMGILFISAFALGLAILSRMQSSVDLYHILFGNILAVSATDLWLTLATGLLVLLTVLVLWKELHLWSFDPVSAQVMGFPVRALHYLLMFLLSVTIVAALQAVGIVLVVAMLITPVATAYLLSQRFSQMMLLASGLGALAGVVGLYLSFHLNIASGATMVLTSTLFFLLAFFFAPGQGLLWRALQRHRAARAVALDDCLKVICELEGRGDGLSVAAVAAAMGEPAGRVRRLVRELRRRGLVTAELALADAGRRRAVALIRSHRLWERFLTDHAGLPWDAVHEEAHRLEHLTPPELADTLAAELGHPLQDPHGAPIPTREGELPELPDTRLDTLAAGSAATVSHVADEDPAGLRAMAALGIRPEARVTVTENPAGAPLTVRVEGREHALTRKMAGQITVVPLDAAAEPAGGAAAAPAADPEPEPAQPAGGAAAESARGAAGGAPAAGPAMMAGAQPGHPAGHQAGPAADHPAGPAAGHPAGPQSGTQPDPWGSRWLPWAVAAGVFLAVAVGLPRFGGVPDDGSGGGAGVSPSAGLPASSPIHPIPDGRPPRVVATLNIIGDLVTRVAGDRAQVRSLLAPGMDPHVYEPVPQDSVAVAQADIVFMNGLDLEGWMEKLVQTAGGNRPVVELAGPEMDLLPWTDNSKRWDPHLWMDPRNAIRYVEKIRDSLSALDPGGREVYFANAAALIAEIEELDRWAAAELSEIPPERRKLVTTHDAYRYFGRRYGLEVLDSVWGISTEDEPSARDIANLVELLRTHRVPPFIETTINPKIMEQVAAQAGVAIGGTLYGDSLGPPGSGADTYVAMMRHNVRTIIQAMEKTLGQGAD